MRMPGERFGHLTIIRLAERCAQSHAFYEVLCDCGKMAIKKDSHLDSKTKYCSKNCTLLLQRYSDLTGKKFGRWTVVERDRPRGTRLGRFWNCICECGTKRSIASGALQAEKTKSCGCLRYIATRKYFTDKESKEGDRAKGRRYRKKHPAKAKSHKIRYGLKFGYATPLWLKEIHWTSINCFRKYLEIQ